MFDRLRVMLMEEFLELRRDRWAMFRLIVPLLIQVIAFGYAATFTVNQVATVVLDLDHSQTSRGLVSHFVATGRFDVVDFAQTQREVTRDLDTGRATVAVVVHAGFQQYLKDGRIGPLQVSVDGTNSNTALIALGYINQIITQFQAEQMASAWPARPGAAPIGASASLQERPWFNEGLED